MGTQPLRIVSVGECTIDHYLELQQERIGGISLNFAVHSKRYGADEVSFISRIGEGYSRKILTRLSREQIDTSHVHVAQGPNARQNILMKPNGDRVFPQDGYLTGVLENFVLNDADLSFIQTKNFVSCAFFHQVEPIFRQLMELPFNGWRVTDFLDLSDYNNNLEIVERFFDRLTIAFISGNQQRVEKLIPISSRTDCLIVVTLGAEGSAALSKGNVEYEPAVKVDSIVDSTGCGDAFQAAFSVAYWRTQNIATSLKAGAEQAARVIQHLGAIGS